MKLRFSINYRTEWGQQLAIDIRYQNTDGTERTAHLPMTTLDGETWAGETAVVESRRSTIASFCYTYLVEDGEGRELRREWNFAPRSYAFDSSKTYIMQDIWRDMPLNSHLYTSAYTTTTGQERSEEAKVPRLPLFRKTIIFRVSAPQLLKSQSLAVIGSHPAIGAWSTARYLPMEYVGGKDWVVSFNADALLLPLEYKYVVIDNDTRQLVRWEEGDNRIIDGTIADGETLVLNGEQLRLAEKPWRAAGVSIPVFSLRSEHSFGTGDFGDLYRFVDWAAATGMKVIQLLPVNDTTDAHTWSDSHPYNIVSAFALHPHYIDLEQLGTLKDKKRMTAFQRQRHELNALSYCDYEAVERVKGEYLRLLFQQQGEATLSSKDFKTWNKDNAYWLEGYVKWLTDTHRWQEDEKELIAYTQYHLHLQLKRAADYARQQGIVLKGDLPIGISRHSAETWQHPQLFHLDMQAGAPPESASDQGQNWGFPTYNWSADEKQLSQNEPTLTDWLQQRLHHMEQYFDALRIDHIQGFFRIWQIPQTERSAVMGHFSPALPMTAGEIEHYGLSFRKDFLTRPLINDRIVDRIFGIHASYVRDTFLEKKAYGLYDLKEEVSTQRKVWHLFDGKNDENSLWIRDGLCRLIANVLFLPDSEDPEMYHPRINAFQEPVFEVLSNEERDAYMHIYHHYFYQRHAMFWGHTGYQRLTGLLAKTRMLICGEDLGCLPECVTPVLDALRILTLEIQRMPKQKGEEFTHLDGNPVRCVSTISTHDMPSLRLWWQENAERTQRYYATMLQKQGRAPEQLPAHLAEEIIARHLYSPAMLCILAWQDWLAMDTELRSKHPREERINLPSDPYNRWQYRMHLTIEDLMKATRFNDKLKTMITRSKR